MGKKTKGTKVKLSKNSKPNLSSSTVKNSSKEYQLFDVDFPIWTFRHIDRDGKFAFNPRRADFDVEDFISKMIAYSNMTWQEILRQTHDNGKSKHHSLSNIDALSKEARDCITRKKFEDKTEALFSFALNNKTRIIGLRDGAEFQVIWYDANHEFATAILKNT